MPLKDRIGGIDVKEAMMAAIAKANLPIAKLTLIITDGASAMIGSVNGLVGLCKADQTFPEFCNFHCIIHLEQLVSKSLKLDKVTKTVMEIVNYICTHALKTTGNSRISLLSWIKGFQVTCRCTSPYGGCQITRYFLGFFSF